MTHHQKRFVVTLDLSMTVLVPVVAKSADFAEHVARTQIGNAFASPQLAGIMIANHSIDLAQVQEVQS